MNNRKHDLRIVPRNERSRAGDAMVSVKSAFQIKTPAAPPSPDLFWECAICGSIEPMALPTGRWIKRSCECQRKARREQEDQWKREDWFYKYRLRTYGGWLGESWADEDVARGDKCKDL